MRHPSRTILSAMAALLVAGMAAGAAVGADASGCQGSATSFTTSGGAIQSVTAPGSGATQDDPFKVDFDGTVAWEGSSDQVIANGGWTVTATPFSFSGDVTNSSGTQEANGTITPNEYLPFAIPGLVLVTVDLSGEGGAACSVSGWIQFSGNPLSSPAGWVAIGLSVLGGIGMLMLLRMLIHVPAVPVGQNRFGRTILGILAGLVLGVGVAALLVMYGVVALGTMTPLLVVGGTAFFGLVLGLLPRRSAAV
jgi:hypothetical protein